MTATQREVEVTGGRALLVTAWRAEDGELVRVVLATRWASDPAGVCERSVTFPPEAVPALCAALTGLTQEGAA